MPRFESKIDKTTTDKQAEQEALLKELKKPKKETVRLKTFSFRLPEELHVELKDFCNETGYKMTTFIEKALQEHLADEKNNNRTR